MTPVIPEHKLNLFTTFDSKTKAFTLPFFLNGTDDYLSIFTSVVNHPHSGFYASPSDYTFFRIGTWCPLTGELDIFPVKESIANALTLVKPLEVSNEA
nr:MAG: nonstructural protein [Microvirus sp.]